MSSTFYLQSTFYTRRIAMKGVFCAGNKFCGYAPKKYSVIFVCRGDVKIIVVLFHLCATIYTRTVDVTEQIMEE